VDHDEQRIASPRLEIGRLVEHAFDVAPSWLFQRSTSRVCFGQAAI
jgi:hypothetical protein